MTDTEQFDFNEVVIPHSINPNVPVEIWQSFKERKVPKDNLVARITEHIYERTKVKKDWIELNVLVALATLCGNLRGFTNGKPWHTNLMAFALGDSGCGKTRVQVSCKYFLDYIAHTYQKELKEMIMGPSTELSEAAQEVLDQLQANPTTEPEEKPKKKKKIKVVRKTFTAPSTWSRAGLMKTIAEKEITEDEAEYIINNEILLYFPEYSQEFIDMKAMEYKRSDNQFICNMYDNFGIDDAIAGDRGHIIVDDVHFNLSAGTTRSIFDSMTKKFFVEGSGNRFIFMVFDKKDSKTKDPTMDDVDRYFMNSEIDDILTLRRTIVNFPDVESNKIGDILFDIYKKCPNGIKFEADAQIRYMEYITSRKKDAEKRNEAGTLNDTDMLYIKRQDVVVLKLAALYAIGEMYNILPGRDNYISVSLKHMDLAIGFMEKSIDNYFRFMEEWHEKPEGEKLVSNKPFVDQVVRCFTNAPDDMRCTGEVQNITERYSDTRMSQKLFALANINPPILDLVPVEEIKRLIKDDPGFAQRHGIVNVNKQLPIFFKKHKEA